jgi:riboflavin kinase/FMN adenylyltransferase
MMKVINIDSSCQIDKKNSATIGFFDGVHSGHRFLINQLKTIADSQKLPSAVITFTHHPKSILQADYTPNLLCTLEERLHYLSETGIDYCFVMDFTKEIAEMTAATFIREVLHKQLNVSYLLIGHDHRFGKDRAENYDNYVDYGKTLGMTVVQALELPGGIPVKSTLIRNELLNRNLESANEMLSYYYSIVGKVIVGNRLGQTIGFPTANIEPSAPCKVIPGDGVYAAWVYISEKKYRGMVYIGRRPTISNNGENRIEVHILDFSGNIYGELIRIEFVRFVRESMTFPNLNVLSEQLSFDKEKIMRSLRL